MGETTNNGFWSGFLKPPVFLTTLTLVFGLIFALFQGYSTFQNQSRLIQELGVHLESTDKRLESLTELYTSKHQGLVDIVNIIGERVNAQALRLSEIYKSNNDIQVEIRSILKDQLATDKLISEKLSTLEVTFAGLRADVNAILRVPIPPSTLGRIPRND